MESVQCVVVFGSPTSLSMNKRRFVELLGPLLVCSVVARGLNGNTATHPSWDANARFPSKPCPKVVYRYHFVSKCPNCI